MLYPRRIEAQTKTVDIFSCTYAHTSYYAKDIFSCTHTHSSFYARDIFSSTYAHTSGYRHLFVHSHTHTSFYARDILSWICKIQTYFLLCYRCFLLHIRTYFLRRYMHLFLHLPTYCAWCYARDIFSCTYTGRKKRCALKNLVPVKPNRMLQWVFKIPGLFKVQF